MRAALARQLLQVRLHGQRRHRVQHGRHVHVDARDDRGNRLDAVGQGLEDLPLAQHPVLEILGDLRGAVLDDGAVGGIDPPHVHLLEPPQRVEIIEQVAVVRGDHRRRAAEDHVAREERLLLDEVVAEVIGGVTRRVDRHQRRAVAVDGLAGAQVIDRLRQVRILVAHLRHAQPLEARPQRADAAEVVAMAVGQDDARRLRPAALAEVVLEQRDVIGHAGAGVDEDRIAAADEVGVGARTRHHPRIESEYATDDVARRGGGRKGRGHQHWIIRRGSDAARPGALGAPPRCRPTPPAPSRGRSDDRPAGSPPRRACRSAESTGRFA